MEFRRVLFRSVRHRTAIPATVSPRTLERSTSTNHMLSSDSAETVATYVGSTSASLHVVRLDDTTAVLAPSSMNGACTCSSASEKLAEKSADGAPPDACGRTSRPRSTTDTFSYAYGGEG